MLRAISWRTEFNASLIAWNSHRYALIQPWTPPSREAARLDIQALKGETRSDAFLICNLTSSAQENAVLVKGLPPEIIVKVAAAPWVDTRQRVLVPAALPWSEKVTLQPGITTRIWVQVDTSLCNAGTYNGTVSIGEVSVPLKVEVVAAQSANSELSLALFDYSAGDKWFDVDQKLRPRMLDLLRSAGVDTVWANRIVPWPTKNDYQGATRVANLDFSALDEWIAKTKGMRHFVFLGNPKNFAGSTPADRDFQEKVRAWARDVADHVADVPLTLLVIDEPLTKAAAKETQAWTSAIVRGSSGRIRIYTDPGFDDLASEDFNTTTEAANVITKQYAAVSRDDGQTFQKKAAELGAEPWLYQTVAGGKSLAPSAYYRLGAWRALAVGARGYAFWSVADNGGAPQSWNEYAAIRKVYTPLFFGDDIVETVHWLALTEGLEDAKVFKLMLKLTRSTKYESAADAILRKAVNVSKNTNQYEWFNDRKPEEIDRIVREAMNLISQATSH